MKKLFTLVAMALMAVGANAQTLIAEKDWSGVTDEELPWIQFAGPEGGPYNGSAKGGADGIEITVTEDAGTLWQPQTMAIADGSFNLEEDGNYRIVVTAKFPTDGTLQINMGTWSANDQASFPVTATGDFQEVVCDFEGWSVTAEGAHLLFQSGNFLGTTILKKVEVYSMDEVAPSDDETVLAEKDWSGVTDEELPWIQFAGPEGGPYNGSAKGGADGIEITVTEDAGTLWQPQTMAIADGSFNLEEDATYKVIVTAKFPTDGTLQINMGTWSANDQASFPVTATGDFQEVECLFEGWSVTAEGAHLLFQSGNFLGTTILKSVKVIQVGGETAIKSVKKADKADGATYNLAGQKVNASYKGVVIKNGKKFIQK